MHETLDVDRRGGGYHIGEHALALIGEMQAAFCAGAFVATVVLACTVIDAHLREVELDEKFQGGLNSSFQASKYSEELEWLRKLRNAIVHFEWRRGGVLSFEDLWMKREMREASARSAIALVGNVIFENPFV